MFLDDHDETALLCPGNVREFVKRYAQLSLKKFKRAAMLACSRYQQTENQRHEEPFGRGSDPFVTNLASERPKRREKREINLVHFLKQQDSRTSIKTDPNTYN